MFCGAPKLFQISTWYRKFSHRGHYSEPTPSEEFTNVLDASISKEERVSKTAFTGRSGFWKVLRPLFFFFSEFFTVKFKNARLVSWSRYSKHWHPFLVKCKCRGQCRRSIIAPHSFFQCNNYRALQQPLTKRYWPTEICHVFDNAPPTPLIDSSSPR